MSKTGRPNPPSIPGDSGQRRGQGTADARVNQYESEFARQQITNLLRLLVAKTTIGNLPAFSDIIGSLKDSGITSASVAQSIANVPASSTVGDLASFSTKTGTITDSNIPKSNLPISGTTSGNFASFSNSTGAFQDSGQSAASLRPSGEITMYGGAAAPTGWLLCDGSAVSRATFAILFGIIGTTFGAGDGSTTFNVPDMRGVFPKGAGTTSRTAGKDASGNFYAGTLGTYLQDQLQGHLHNTHKAIAAGGDGSGSAWSSTTTTNTAQDAGPATDGTNGTPRTGHTTEPQSLGVTYIIKT